MYINELHKWKKPDLPQKKSTVLYKTLKFIQNSKNLYKTL